MFLHKKRTSAGMKRYRPPKSGWRVSLLWGKWETVAKFDTFLEACEALKDVRPVMSIGPGSTEHKLTFGGKDVISITNKPNPEWDKAKQRLDRQEVREDINNYEKRLRGEQ